MKRLLCALLTLTMLMSLVPVQVFAMNGSEGLSPEAAAEEPLVEEAPAEELPVEEPPTTEPPVEELPVEEPPVEEPPVEEPPVEEPPVEEPPVEEPPVEEAPAVASVTVLLPEGMDVPAVGGTVLLSAVVKPAEAVSTVAWQSSDEAVATVDETGLVTALDIGTVIISATADNGVRGELELTITEVGGEVEQYDAASGTCGDNLRWTLSDAGVLTISGTGAMDDYYSLNPAPWGDYREIITSAVIKNGVSHIGSQAFLLCSSLRKISISASVASIGTATFCVNQCLTEINVDTANTTFKSLGGVLYNKAETELIKCPGGKTGSITIPASVTTLRGEALMGGNSLSSIEVAADNEAFRSVDGFLCNRAGTELIRCPGAKSGSISIPRGVTAIGISAFERCSKLTNVNITLGVSSIGASAFVGCYGLTHISIPFGLNEIGNTAFSDCTSLTSIEVSSGNTTFKSVNGFLCNKAGTELIMCPPGIKNATVPAGISSIAQNAFFYCFELNSVTLPSGTRSIGSTAFAGCFSLSSITMPSSLQSIDAAAFAGCTSLAEVHFQGTQAQWNAIVIGENNETLRNACVTFAGLNRWEFSYRSTYNGEKTYDMEYSDSYFDSDSYSLNSELMLASLKLAMSAFGSTDTSEPDKNVHEMMKNIGCNKYEKWDYDKNVKKDIMKNTTDSIGVAIGSKPLDSGETLVIVAVRGGGYGAEWGGNFRVGGDWGLHSGFSEAADKVLDRLNAYISNQGLQGSIKLWITGYSRAAATANIVAGTLDDDLSRLPSSVSLSSDDLYAYTFETPAGVNSLHPHSSRYGNIFNVVNSNDFVTKVAPIVWFYQRYGVDVYLPDANNAVRDAYERITDRQFIDPFLSEGVNVFGHEFTVLPRQSSFLDLALGKFALTLGGELSYRTLYQKTLIYSCLLHNDLPSFDVLFNTCLTILAVANGDVVARILQKGKNIEFGHYPEQCLAYLESGVSFGSGRYKYSSYNCPVDIMVYSGGTLVGSIENEAVTFVGDENIDMCIDENGQKMVFVYGDGVYDVQAVAREPGTMDCTVVDFYASEGKTLQTSYLDLELAQAGQVYESTMQAETEGSDMSTGGQPVLPDAVLTPEQMYSSSVSVTVSGSGSVTGASDLYTIGDQAALYASAGEGSVFLGWYENGAAVSREESYVFIVRGDRALTAVFAAKAVTVRTDREYLAIQLAAGADQSAAAQRVAATVSPGEWTEFLTWAAEGPEGGQTGVITVDQTGLVTPVAVGTAYAVATVAYKDYVFMARCRVDVTDRPVEEQISGVQLGAAALTTELYKLDYARFQVVFDLPQNQTGTVTQYAAAGPGGAAQEDKGVAISSARFTDEATAAVFDLIVTDDRTLAVAPKAGAVAAPATVKGSYASPVAVTVGAREFTAAGSLRLTVKKTLPKLQFKGLSFNSFYTGQSLTPEFTGGTVTALSVNPAKNTARSSALPAWLSLDNGALSLRATAPKSGSGTAHLLAQVEGWAVPATVALGVRLGYTAPALKLSATAVTLNPDASASAGAALSLSSKVKGKDLQDLNVTGITASGGYEVRDFDLMTGGFTLAPTADPVAGKPSLAVRFGDTQATVAFKLSVRVAAAVVTAKPTAVTLNPRTGDSAAIELTVSPADFILSAPSLRLTDATGKADLTGSGVLDIGFSGGTVTVSSNAQTPYNGSWRLYIGAFPGAKEKQVTVKTLAEARSAVTLSARAGGSVDLSFPGSAAKLELSYKNYLPDSGETVSVSIEERAGRTVVGDATDRFVLAGGGKSYTLLRAGEADIDPSHGYYAVLSSRLPNGDMVRSGAIKLPVKRTAVKLKLSRSSLTVNPSIDDPAAVTVSSATKGFSLGTPIWALMAKDGRSSAQGALDIGWAEGRLTVAPNASTGWGTSYKLLIRAAQEYPAVTLTVTTPARARSAVTGTVKAGGFIDVLRENTAITLTPAYKNFNGQAAVSRRAELLTGSADAGAYFDIAYNDDGSVTVKAADGLDPKLKYKARLVTDFGGGTVVYTPYVSLNVKMGQVSAKLSPSEVTLYRRDRYSTGQFGFIVSDKSLGPVERVEIRDAKFAALYEIHDFGGGSFAIGFAGNQVTTVKEASVALKVFFRGNPGAAQNLNCTIKVRIK